MTARPKITRQRAREILQEITAPLRHIESRWKTEGYTYAEIQQLRDAGEDLLSLSALFYGERVEGRDPVEQAEHDARWAAYWKAKEARYAERDAVKAQAAMEAQQQAEAAKAKRRKGAVK